MLNTQKMLLEGWQPWWVWPTTIEGRAIASGSVGHSCRIRRSIVDLECVYSTRCSARSRNAVLSATSESGSGEQDIAVPTCRKRWRPLTWAIRRANCSVPSTLTFQISGLLPNEATAAQLSTWVTWFRRGSWRKGCGLARSPSRMLWGVRAVNLASLILNFRRLSLIRSTAATLLSARTNSNRLGAFILLRMLSNTAPPRNPVAPVINNVFMNAVSLVLVDWILGAEN